MKFHRLLSLTAALSTLVLTACDNAPKSKSKQAEEPGSNPLNAPTDYLGAVAKSKKAGESAAGTIQVTSAIKQFKAAEGRNPKSIAELVEQRYLGAEPKAPYGMKATYDAQTGEFGFVKE